MSWPDRIVTDGDICGGRPRLRGTRLTVEFLLGLKAAGWTETQILENYPNISVDDLKPVFEYALEIIEEGDLRSGAPTP